MISDIYRILVIECGLNPEYFLDRMEPYEIRAALDGARFKNRESWEQTRLMAYISAQSNSTKQLKPEDILKFPWDGVRPDSNMLVSDADIERLKRKAEEYIKSK